MNYFQPTEHNHLQNGIHSTSIEGVLYIERTKHTDNRGFFSEVCRIHELNNVINKSFQIAQVNHARSEKHVVRGIHAEGWNKLVFLLNGTAVSVIADVRKGSKTYGVVEYFRFGEGPEATQGSLFLPSGVGNSLCVLDGPLDYVYVVDRLYSQRDPKGDKAISLFDPTLNIQWPIAREDMIISERDENGIFLER